MVSLSSASKCYFDLLILIFLFLEKYIIHALCGTLLWNKQVKTENSNIKYKKTKNKADRVKPLNRGHLRVLKNLSAIKRCPLLGGSLTKIVIFALLGVNILSAIQGMSAIWDVRYWKVSLYYDYYYLLK